VAPEVSRARGADRACVEVMTEKPAIARRPTAARLDRACRARARRGRGEFFCSNRATSSSGRPAGAVSDSSIPTYIPPSAKMAASVPTFGGYAMIASAMSAAVK